MKKIIGISLSAVIAFSGINAAFASENRTQENKKIKSEYTYDISKETKVAYIQPSKQLILDGKIVDLKGMQIYEKNGHIMLPLKYVGECLGYTVKTNGKNKSVELNKGAQWTSVTCGKDSYFFGKIAPFKIGVAPEIKNSVIYVPCEFFSSVLKLDVNVDSKKVIISQPKVVNNYEIATLKYGEKSVLSVGNEFMLALNENASTGYIWGYEISSPDGIRIVSEQKIEKNNDKNLVGASYPKVWIFRADKAGTYKIKFTYARPWEKDKNSTSFEYEVEVK